jgi:diacylglycerol kinase (ATP)
MAAMASPFGTLAVIADPRAGVLDQLPALERALEERGLEHRTFVANGADPSALARDALDGGFRFLVAMGDDATVQGVVNGMFRDGRPIREEPVLGVIGAGSGCDLVRSFGVPGDTESAAAHLTGENTYGLDLMKITATTLGGERVTRYGHNLAQVGMGAQQVACAAKAPAWLGGSRRFYGFWCGYLKTKAARFTVEHDRRTWEGRAWNVVVANAQFTGGGLRLSPRSFPGDGVLDALVFTGPRSGAYTQLPRLFRHGDHVPDPQIKELKAKIRFEVRSERPMPVIADGVALGTTPVTFQIVPRPILFKL